MVYFVDKFWFIKSSSKTVVLIENSNLAIQKSLRSRDAAMRCDITQTLQQSPNSKKRNAIQRVQREATTPKVHAFVLNQ